MRVLIADRNARLLEAIARSFAHPFTIQTATSHEGCNELLAQGGFDLAVVSEKLADARGLQLLGQIARDSPGTLRVLAARRSRLELLEGKLEPFGLFCTLSYPIDPRELLAVLTRGGEVLAGSAGAGSMGDVAAFLHAQPEGAQPEGVSAALPSAVRSALERISLSSTGAVFADNVLMTIASMESARRSDSRFVPPAPPPLSVSVSVGRSGDERRSRKDAADADAQMSGRQPAQAQPTQAQLTQAQSAHGQLAEAQSTQPQSVRGQPARVQRAASQSAVSRGAPVPRSATPSRSPSQSEAFQRALARRRSGNRAPGSQVGSQPSQLERVQRAPMRRKLVLAGTIAAVFLVTTLTFNLLDAGVHVTRASAPSPQIAPPISASTETPTPAGPMPAFTPTPKVAQRAEPQPAAPQPVVEPADPQVAATNGPVADPSSFGSEAYEPIYSN